MLFDKFEHEERFIAAFEKLANAFAEIALKTPWPGQALVFSAPSPAAGPIPDYSPIWVEPNTGSGQLTPQKLPQIQVYNSKESSMAGEVTLAPVGYGG